MSFASKLTVSDMSTQLSGFTPGGYSFLQALNQVHERFFLMGLFKGMVAKVVFANGTSTGIITLPRRYESLMGIALENSYPVPVYGAFHEWKELSFGYIEPNQMTMSGVIDMQDGYPTTVDIVTEGVLRVTILDAGDAGETIRLFGTGTVNSVAGSVIFDSSGNEGINLTTVNPTADTTQTFASVTGVQIPSTVTGRVRLSVVNSGTPTQLAEYEPGETRPAYRRYKTGVIDTNIIGFCKLRFVPYVANTDFVLVPNLGATKCGLQALQKEDALAIGEANKFWAQAQVLLQQQLKSFRGSAKPNSPLVDLALSSAPPIVI